MIASPFQAQDRALLQEDTVVTESRFSRAPLRSVAALRAVAALGTVALLVVAGGALARGADAAVSIVDFAFQPATITIDAGATVTWTVTRAQDPHTVSPVDPPDGFVGSPLLRQGDHFSVTFAQAGTYRYQCTIHPEEMQGTVIVQAAASTSTPTPTTVATPSATATNAPLATDSPAPTGSPAPQEPSGGGPATIAVVVAVLAAAGVAGWFLLMRWMRR